MAEDNTVNDPLSSSNFQNKQNYISLSSTLIIRKSNSVSVRKNSLLLVFMIPPTEFIIGEEGEKEFQGVKPILN